MDLPAQRLRDGFLNPIGYGSYSVSGNVWEQCADWFSRDFRVNGLRENLTGLATGRARAVACFLPPPLLQPILGRGRNQQYAEQLDR